MSSEKTQNLIIVPSSQIAGHKIKEVKGMVWATSVRAKFFLDDIKAIFRIIIGGEVKEYRDLLNEGRWELIRRVNKNAKTLGGNAVVDFRMLSGQTIAGTIEIMGYGTAVVVEKEKNKK